MGFFMGETEVDHDEVRGVSRLVHPIDTATGLMERTGQAESEVNARNALDDWRDRLKSFTVEKRDGRVESMSVDKIFRFLQRGCEAAEGCEPDRLAADVWPQLRDGMRTSEIARVAIQAAVEKTSVAEPGWQFVAARLLLLDAYKQAARNRGYDHIGYGDFYALIVELERIGRYGKYIREHYSEDEIAELAAYIKPERDHLFNYVGLKQLLDRYAIRNLDNGIMELPQELFMGVSMHLAMKEKDKLGWAKRFYDMLSTLQATVATPTLSNARKPFHQLSSCFIDMPEDDLVSIYATDEAFARVSKFGGGMGIYVGKIRARGSAIRNHPGASGGVVPWIRNFNNTAVSCNQLGMRAGAAAVYLDVWHKDILDFLQLRTNNGDERMKAHDIFPGVCIPDLFMRRVEERGMWYLFCPYEVRNVMGFSLEDSWGEEFERRYQACVDNPDLPRVQIPAIEIMKRIMQSAFETGTPFIFFRDTANRYNPNKHAGMVYCSNLCTEIIQNMSPSRRFEETEEGGIITTKTMAGDFVVCNLSSLNLGRCRDLDSIPEIVRRQIRAMDNVIDLNHYPVPQAAVTNRKYRERSASESAAIISTLRRKAFRGSRRRTSSTPTSCSSGSTSSPLRRRWSWRAKGPYPLFEGSDWQTGRYFRSP